MRLPLLAPIIVPFVVAAASWAAPPIDVELASERGVQATAPREWLQLFAEIGVTNVRIRGANRTDKPAIDNRGTADEPRYHVLGVIGGNNELHLPDGTFQPTDRRKLEDYFARLSADGAESLTAPRGRFGLTERNFAAVHAELAQPINFDTQGQSLRSVLDRFQKRSSLRLVPDAEAERIIAAAAPIADDVSRLTAGTGLAILLHNGGLALRPEKAVGQPVAIRIVTIESADDAWPIGWESPASPREAAPALFEFLNVEIEGYSLQAALDAIAPRIMLPLYWDRAALAKWKIDPAAIQVHVPRTRTFYKRIVDRVLAQAHLAGRLRVDEGGTAFLWISR